MSYGATPVMSRYEAIRAGAKHDDQVNCQHIHAKGRRGEEEEEKGGEGGFTYLVAATSLCSPDGGVLVHRIVFVVRRDYYASGLHLGLAVHFPVQVTLRRRHLPLKREKHTASKLGCEHDNKPTALRGKKKPKKCLRENKSCESFFTKASPCDFSLSSPCALWGWR